MIQIYCLCTTSCLIISAGYHTLKCHSEGVNRVCKWQASALRHRAATNSQTCVAPSHLFIQSSLDFCGISLQITITVVSWTSYAIASQPHWRLFYLVAYPLLGAAMALMSLSHRFAHNDSHFRRTASFAALALCALAPWLQVRLAQ